MKIWIIAAGEPVPVGPSFKDRLHRGGYFAHFLARTGHEVVWWTSAFDHFGKKFLETGSDVLRPEKNLEIRPLRGCGYARNVSPARLRDHRMLGAAFAAAARTLPRPEAILCAYPTIELSLEAVRYGKEAGVPIALDIRDLWPDIFLELAPGPLRPVMKLFLSRMYSEAAEACAGASAILGVTDEYVRWGLEKAGRPRGDMDRSFPFGYEKRTLSGEEAAAAQKALLDKGVGPYGGMTVCFFGTLGRQFDIDTVLSAARMLGQKKAAVRFVFCGTGDRLDDYRSRAVGLPNCVFPGWIGGAEIAELMKNSSVGLAPYRESDNFRWNVPNKIGEYLSGGLPVALSLRSGVARDLLLQSGCCLAYDGDAEKLAVALSSLVSDKRSLQSMRSAAERLFLSSFEASAVYGAMAGHLERL